MKPLVPEIINLKPRKALSVITLGDPNKVAAPFMKALYGTAYGTKMKVFKPKGIVMTLGPLSAFWPDANIKPKDEWTGIWNLEVSPFVKTSDLLQKDKDIEIKLEELKSGKAAQVLFLGKYSNEGPTIEKLHQFIREQGYKIAGNHEEVYLTRPDAKEPKTIIRYLVEKNE